MQRAQARAAEINRPPQARKRCAVRLAALSAFIGLTLLSLDITPGTVKDAAQDLLAWAKRVLKGETQFVEFLLASVLVGALFVLQWQLLQRLRLRSQ